MPIDIGFMFDGEGWVLPVMSIDGEVIDDALDPQRISREDQAALMEAGLYPDEVGEDWKRRGAA